jgi:hypothetical protein
MADVIMVDREKEVGVFERSVEDWESMIEAENKASYRGLSGVVGGAIG